MSYSKRTPSETSVLCLMCIFAAICFIISVILTAEKVEEPSTTIIVKEVPTEVKQAYVEITEPKTTKSERISIGTFKVTGYVATCEHCCGKSDGITASGAKAKIDRTVAMNRADMRALGIEYGDEIYIEGIGERIVEDTGCKQGVLDIVCASHEDCYKITGYYDVQREEV